MGRRESCVECLSSIENHTGRESPLVSEKPKKCRYYTMPISSKESELEPTNHQRIVDGEVLSHAAEDYLKCILKIGDREAVPNQKIADALDVKPASVTKMIKKLETMNLVENQPYYGTRLTPTGHLIAVEILRHHRLIETFLHKIMGLPWDQVHEEAERWEHVLSEAVESKMDAMLGFPSHDPHGDPIPTASLEMRGHRFPSLDKSHVGEGVMTVAAVSDADGEFLRQCADWGLRPGVRIDVLERSPSSVTIELPNNGRRLELHQELAASIFVKETV